MDTLKRLQAGWGYPTALLCVYGFFSTVKPLEPFLIPYLTGPDKNLTTEQVANEIFPVWTYSYLVILLPVFLLTDYLRYKPVIIFQCINLLVNTALLLWAEGVAAMQAMEFFYGVVTASEVAYFSYIYSVVDPQHYRRATSYCRSIQLLGYTVGSVLGQVLVSTSLMSFYNILIMTLVFTAVALATSLLLPMPQRSMFFHRRLSRAATTKPSAASMPPNTTEEEEEKDTGGSRPPGTGEREVTPGAGTRNCEVTPGAGTGDCEVTPRAGTGDCEVTPGAGTRDCEVTPGAGTGDCEVIPGAGTRNCEVTPGAGNGDCEVTPGAGTGDCEVTPERVGTGDCEVTPGAGTGDCEVTPERVDASSQRSARGCLEIIRHLWRDCLQCYSRSLLCWSIWWALATCGYNQTINYVQVLWEHVEPSQNFTIYNGGVEALSSLFGAASAYAIGFTQVNWTTWGEVALGSCSALGALALFLMTFMGSIWVCYAGYIIFKSLYMLLITIAMFQIAAELSMERYALIFGVNTFGALVCQTVLTVVVVDSSGLGLDIIPQFTIYGSYFSSIAAIFLLRGLYIQVRGCRDHAHNCPDPTQVPAQDTNADRR